MNFDGLKEYMDELIGMGVPGLELIVCRDHKVLFHECTGVSDKARMRAAAPTDRYWLYSCTKPITVTAAMRAMEEGMFRTEDEVGKYLPAFRDVYLLKDGQRLKPQHTMTVRHLMTMSAGLNYDFRRESVRRVIQENGGRATTVQVCEALAQDPLDFEPGERFQYSLCHDVLGALIEKVSGMSLRDYMQDRIFRPLGMTDTDFVTEGCPERLAAQYAYDKDANKVLLHGDENTFVISPLYYSGGAGVVSTASDYLKFADALACGGVSADGTRILTAESIDRMRTQQMNAYRMDNTFGCTCGEDYGYGLGVRTRISNKIGHPSAMGEFGWDGAAGSDLLVDPEHRLSMTYMQHVLGWPSLEGIVHLKLRDLLYPALNL